MRDALRGVSISIDESNKAEEEEEDDRTPPVLSFVAYVDTVTGVDVVEVDMKEDDSFPSDDAFRVGEECGVHFPGLETPTVDADP